MQFSYNRDFILSYSSEQLLFDLKEFIKTNHWFFFYSDLDDIGEDIRQ